MFPECSIATGRARACLLGAALAVLAWLSAGAAGCKSTSPSKPERPTPEQVWAKGQRQLDSGDLDAAFESFAESLAMADSPAGRYDAVVQFAGASRFDLARKLLAGQGSPRMLAMDEAMSLFEAAPPSGSGGEAYAVAPVSEALLAWSQCGRAGQGQARNVSPLRLSPDYLRVMLHHWQSWVRLREVDLNAPTGPGEPAKMIVVWGSDNYDPSVYRSDFLIHSSGTVNQGSYLAHQGGWPLAADGLGDDAIVIDGGAGALSLFWHAWQGDRTLAQLRFDGYPAEGDFIVQWASAPAQLQAMLGRIADTTISAWRIVPRNQAEREEILSLANRLRPQYIPAFDGGVIVVAGDASDPDSQDRGQWLADVAGYIRYGRNALRIQE